MCKSSFTLYFEDPFWVGVYQREEDGHLRVCRVVFGGEPRDGEVYRFLLDNWHRLVFSPPAEAGRDPAPVKNPKRAQRAIAKSLRRQGVGTKAQNALKQAQQAGKQAKKERTARQKKQDAQRRFEERTAKKREKRKGH